ncbi:MAG: PilZ domain-containing protein [Phycisphaerae bacterium]
MATKQNHGMERRRHHRIKLTKNVKALRLDPDGGDIVEALETVDVSRSGLGVLCQRSFYPGQRMVLQMPRANADGMRNICATVVRCSRKEEQFRVGMEFDGTSVDTSVGVAEEFAAA